MITFTEVNEFDKHFVMHQDVGGFEVKMHNLMISKKPDTLSNWVHKNHLTRKRKSPPILLHKLFKGFKLDIVNKQALMKEIALVFGEIVFREKQWFLFLDYFEDVNLMLNPAFHFIEFLAEIGCQLFFYHHRLFF